jgi:hypothetical protein
MPRNVRPGAKAKPLRLHGLPDVDVGMANDQGVGAARTVSHRVGDPRFLGTGDEVVNQYTEPPPGTRRELCDDVHQFVYAAKLLDDDTFDPEILAPYLRDEFGVVATLDIDPAGAGDSGASTRHGDRAGRRPGSSSRRGPARRSEDDGTAVEQIPRAQRETTDVAASIFQVDSTVFDSHHRAHIAGLGVLDHETQVGRVLGRAGLASTRGKNIGPIAIHHAGNTRKPCGQTSLRRARRSHIVIYIVMTITLAAAHNRVQKICFNCVALAS